MRYIEAAKQYPMLSAEDEKRLFQRFQDSGDEEALEQIIGSHLRLVVKIARDNAGYGEPLSDLVGEGLIGLLRAAERFDLEHGCRFATYASWWIRATMREYILTSSSLVKIGTTAAQKKLFFNLRRLKHELKVQHEGELAPKTVAKIAAELAVREDEVTQMDHRLSHRDCTLNASVGDGEGADFQDYLVDEAPDPEAVVAEADDRSKRRALLRDGLAALSDREQHILSARTLSEEPQTLAELGDHFGISRERVRQIEGRAIQKLRVKVLSAANEAKALSGLALESPMPVAA